MQVRKALALSPHTDDTELGCGGSVARLVEEGTEVHVAVFSLAEESLPRDAPRDALRHECLEALSRLGVPAHRVHFRPFPVRRLATHRQEVLEALVALRRELEPDLVLLPAASDLHQDHQVVSAEGLRAFKERTVLGYELPWNHLEFAAQAFCRLEQRHLERKWTALRAYQTQAALARSYFDQGFVEGLARVRGTQVRTRWAEAFQVLRMSW